MDSARQGPEQGQSKDSGGGRSAGFFEPGPAPGHGGEKIAVFGDAGRDIYSVNTGSLDGTASPWARGHAKDIAAPSGMKMTRLILQTLLDPNNTGKIGPDSFFADMPGKLRFLGGFPAESDEDQTVYRQNRIQRFELMDHADGDGTQGPEISQWQMGAGVEYAALTDFGRCGAQRFAPDCEFARGLIRVAEQRPSVSEQTPGVFIEVGDRFLSGDCFGADQNSQDQETFWSLLGQKRYRDRVCVVVSGTTLRLNGAAISRRLSWEDTVENAMDEVDRFEPLARLARYGHLVIRFGLAGAVYVRNPPTGDRQVRFAFMPRAKHGIVRYPSDDGVIAGKNVFLIAALLAAIRRGEPEWFRAGLERGLDACKAVFIKGYDARYFEDTYPGKNRGEGLICDLAGAAKEACNPSGSAAGGGAIAGAQSNARVSIEIRTVPVPQDLPKAPEVDRWRILDAQFRRAEDDPDLAQSLEASRRVGLAMAIAKYGLRGVLNADFAVDPSMGLVQGDAGELPPNDGITRQLTAPVCVLDGEDQPDGRVDNPDDDPRDIASDSRPVIMDDLSRALRPNTGASRVGYVSPMTDFEKLRTVERDEIETFRSIHNLIKSYVENEQGEGRTSRPISIAVFGPPGSGKSFTVKQIAESINASLGTRRKRIQPVGCNVAQFRNPDDLGHFLHRVASTNNQDKIPLVFFDEFDTKNLEWLQHFLAPMQDGEFYGAKQTITIGPAIFVFAGGVNHNFEEFETNQHGSLSKDDVIDLVGDEKEDKRPEDGKDSEAAKEARRKARKEAIKKAMKEALEKAFRARKGPDFVSRLRGHIDIRPLSVEHDDPRNQQDGGWLPVVRRAIALRVAIEQSKRLHVDSTSRAEVAAVDDEILYAILTMRKYRHGVRSIGALLQMCTPMGSRIEKTSLPSRAQMDMHMKSEEFMTRLHRGRMRARFVYGPTPSQPPADEAAAASASAK